jgi:uncharacterized SAM-binding protein YcdF (DUF218 family)
VLIVLVALTVLAALTARLFVWPSTDPPRRADAVLVFAGGRGERLREGLRLVRAGVAPVLAVSDGGVRRARFARVCGERPAGVRVVCVTPAESSTRAEARAFGELAGREGWRSVVVVTSDYHLRRASLYMGRCYGGRVFTAAAGRGGRGDLLVKALHEWGGLLAAFTLQRGC